MNIKSGVFPLGTILSKPATGLFFYNPFSFLLPTGGTQSNKCSAGFPSLFPLVRCRSVKPFSEWQRTWLPTRFPLHAGP